MTILMAFIFLLTGIFCIHRPTRIVEWLAHALKRLDQAHEPEWLQGRGIIYFIRLLGLLALINSAMLFFLSRGL